MPSRHGLATPRRCGAGQRHLGELAVQSARRAADRGFARFEAMVARIPITNVSPVLEQGRYPVKAVPGEALTVEASVFREGHDAARRRRRPHRPEGQGPAARPHDGRCDFPAATARRSHPTPKARGPTGSSRGPTRTPPGGTHAEIKIPAEIDVELMFTEGALVLKRAIKNIPARTPEGKAARETLTSAAAAGRDKKLPVPVRLAALTSPEVERRAARLPAARPGVERGPVPDVRRPRARALRLLVRVLPPLARARRTTRRRRRGVRHVHHRSQAARRAWPTWASTSSTCRRSIRSASSTARAPTTR